MESLKDLMILQEACNHVGINTQTIMSSVKRGSLVGRKILGKWRFRKDDLDKWVNNIIEGGVEN